MIKIVAFDWNGTLLSDTLACVRAENKALLAIGAKTITVEKFRQNFQIPIMKYWKNLGFSESYVKANFKTIEEVFHPNYELNANKARTRAGAKSLLEWLSRNKINSVIYSNHHIPGIQKHLIRLSISQFFSEVLARGNESDDSQIYKRSKEQKLVDYISRNKIKPKQVISVGDSEEEIEIGKKCGFYSVALTGGWNSTDRLKKHKPDFLIHNLAEVKNIIKKLNRK